jgi:hypothetical protein
MKTYLTTLAAIVSAIIIADPAHATTCKNGATNYPTCTLPSGGGAGSTSGATSGASAGAVAGAAAGAVAGAAGGAGGGGGAGGSGGAGGIGTGAAAAGDSAATLQDSSSFWSQSRALGLTFAPGAFTPPMAPVQCASATITQSARGLGMGILSKADSKTDSSDCTLIQMRNAAVAACKFETAKKIEDGLVKKHLPDFEPSSTTYLKDNNDPGYVDYSPTQCALLTSPPPPPKEPVTLNWIYVPPPVARTEDKPAEPIAPAAAPPKPRKPAGPVKNISNKPPKPAGPGTTLNCGDDGVPQCVAKPRKPIALGGAQDARS